MIRHLPPTLVGAALALGIIMASGQNARGEDAPPPWQATEGRDHPLVGRIWRAADGAFIAPEELARVLASARLVLVGETHDNPDHHRIQAWAVARVAALGAKPGIALEMIGSHQQGAVAAHFQARPGDAAGLGAALKWEDSGWPDWSHYAPIVAPVVAAGGMPMGADLPAITIRRIATAGFAALGEERMRELALDRPIPESVYGELIKEMIAAHCGQIRPERARPFAIMQIARDAALADGLLVAAHDGGGRGILIAGNGHVRGDRGVPMHLERRGARSGIVVLAPLEARDGADRPEAYGEGFGAARPPFDFVWFTPRAVRTDPCLSFKRKNNGKTEN